MQRACHAPSCIFKHLHIADFATLGADRHGEFAPLSWPSQVAPVHRQGLPANPRQLNRDVCFVIQGPASRLKHKETLGHQVAEHFAVFACSCYATIPQRATHTHSRRSRILQYENLRRHSEKLANQIRRQHPPILQLKTAEMCRLPQLSTRRETRGHGTCTHQGGHELKELRNYPHKASHKTKGTAMQCKLHSLRSRVFLTAPT